MKFGNKTSDTIYGPAFGYVDPDGEVDLSPEQAAGVVLQCTKAGSWEPRDDEARAAVDAASDEPAKKPVAKKAATNRKSGE